MAVKSASNDYNLDRPKAPQVSRVLTASKVFTGRRGGIVDDGAVVIVDGKVAWAGPNRPQQHILVKAAGYFRRPCFYMA